MKAPIGWWWPLVAGVALVVTFVAGPRYSVAVPAATVAVIAAALAFIEPLRQRRTERARRVYAPPVHVGSVREAFAGGEPGREDIVLTLDLLERRIDRPDLPARTGPEITALVRQPPEAFRRYLAARLDDLERRS
ncbi:MAG TPA: hypothetical protein VMH49_06065 [Thermoplasmata archaeon]|nr:hypothetical protein [Thermoplasmata archaeon]